MDSSSHSKPAIFWHAAHCPSPQVAEFESSLQAQTIPVSWLRSPEELQSSKHSGILFLPFAAQFVPSLLENLQHSLECIEQDFLLLPPAVSAQDSSSQSSCLPLGQEKVLEEFCHSFPLPPLFATAKLLKQLLEHIQSGTPFPQLLKQENWRTLLIERPWLFPLHEDDLPSIQANSPSNSSQAVKHSHPHTHLSTKPSFTSYAPLSPNTPPPWQKPRPRPESRPQLIQLLPYLEMGGADKFALDLCEALPRYTHWEVSLLTTDSHPNAWLEKARSFTNEVHELPAFLPPSALPSAIARFAQSRQAQALLLTHSFLGYRLLPWLAHTLPDLTLVDYLHVEHPHWKSGGHPRLSILQQDYLDASISSSAHLANWCQQHGRDPRGQAIVHTNIDTEVWNPADFEPEAIRREFNIPAEHCLILVAMRMVYQKQPELLLELLSQLESEALPFTCLICGDGEQFELIQQLHQEHNLQQSHLLGAKPNSEVKRLMAAADVFLLPTRMEGIALSLFEAMAMECAPVAAAVGGQAELVSPETGSLIDRSQGREAEQAAYLDALRELIQSPELREQKKHAARARIEGQFSLRQMAEKLGQALDQAPQNRAPRPKLSARQAETLATEAVEASQLQEQLEAGELTLRKHFMGRITQRDQQLEKLKAKLEKTQTELAELHAKRESMPWRKLERKFRRK